MRAPAVFAILFALGLPGCTRADPPAEPARSGGGIIGTAPPQAPPGPATPPPPGPRFVGRFDTTDPNAVRFAWSGSAIVARFEGTGISARMRDEAGRNVFQVFIDGEPRSTFKVDPTRESYKLAEGLPEGTHEVSIYKRTEARVGEAVFLGFDPVGRLLPPPPAAERRILLLGDSITTGYGVEGPSAACGFLPDQQNELVTYGALTARTLGAEHHTVAWSGKTILEMTELWDRTLPARPESRWDLSAFVPQAVVINLGTNNFALADPGEERFVRLYTQLVNRVRKTYPEALVVCVLGPMLSDVYPEGHRSLTQAKKYMKTSVAKLRAAGDTRVELLELPEQKHSDGLGCGFHPSSKTQKLNAERLTALLREKLSW